jgi:hypothetical protein
MMLSFFDLGRLEIRLEPGIWDLELPVLGARGRVMSIFFLDLLGIEVLFGIWELGFGPSRRAR